MSVEDSIFEDVVAESQAEGQQQVQEESPAPNTDGEAGKEQQQAQTVAGDERSLPRWIRDLKSNRPQDFAAAKDAFFGQKTLSDKVKDRDLDKIFGFVDEHGGLDGISQSRAELEASKQEYDTLLSDVASGNPAIAERLFETAGAKAPDIARAVMSQYASKDPDGWSNELMPVFAATIMQGQAMGLDGKTAVTVPQLISETRYALQYAQTPEQKAEIATNALNSLTGFLSGFTNAKAAPQGTQQQDKRMSEVEKREQSLNEREQSQFLGSVRTQLKNDLYKDAERSLESYFSRRPEDKDARELAIRNVISEINERLGADKDFGKKWDSHLANKKDGDALKLASSRRQAIIGEISAKVGRTIFGNPTQKVTPPVKQASTVARTPSTVRPPNKFDEIWAR